MTGGPRTSRQVCLTFDDGPDPVHTPRLLDVLGQLGITATFFLIGRRAEVYPDIVRRIVAEGHEIGNHTWSHRHPHTLSSAEFIDEVRHTDALLLKVTGRRSVFYRPPHGKLTSRQLFQAWSCRQTIVLWNHDAKDYARTSADDLASFFEKQPPRGGDIVLMHDTSPFAAEVLPRLTTDAQRRGLSFATPRVWVPDVRRAPCSPIT